MSCPHAEKIAKLVHEYWRNTLSQSWTLVMEHLGSLESWLLCSPGKEGAPCWGCGEGRTQERKELAPSFRVFSGTCEELKAPELSAGGSPEVLPGWGNRTLWLLMWTLVATQLDQLSARLPTKQQTAALLPEQKFSSSSTRSSLRSSQCWGHRLRAVRDRTCLWAGLQRGSQQGGGRGLSARI